MTTMITYNSMDTGPTLGTYPNRAYIPVHKYACKHTFDIPIHTYQITRPYTHKHTHINIFPHYYTNTTCTNRQAATKCIRNHTNNVTRGRGEVTYFGD